MIVYGKQNKAVGGRARAQKPSMTRVRITAGNLFWRWAGVAAARDPGGLPRGRGRPRSGRECSFAPPGLALVRPATHSLRCGLYSSAAPRQFPRDAPHFLGPVLVSIPTRPWLHRVVRG